MKEFIVDSDPKPFRTSQNFKRFSSDLKRRRDEQIDEYSEHYFIRKIQQYGDLYYLCELLKFHIGFVVCVARQMQASNIPFDDLMNDGLIGFIKASYRYDNTRKARFLSYAVWWIRSSIIQSIAQENELIRLPMNQFQLLLEIKKKIEVLSNKTGQDFTHRYSEIACELEVPVGRVSDVINAPTRSKILSFDDFHKRYTDSDTLIDVSFSIGDSYSFENIEKSYDDELYTYSLRKEISRSLRTLTEREEQIVRLFFGIGLVIKDGLVVESDYCDEGSLLEEIGEVFGLTRERTRQIKEKAIRRLRHSSRSRLLRGYLG